MRRQSAPSAHARRAALGRHNAVRPIADQIAPPPGLAGLASARCFGTVHAERTRRTERERATRTRARCVTRPLCQALVTDSASRALRPGSPFQGANTGVGAGVVKNASVVDERFTNRIKDRRYANCLYPRGHRRASGACPHVGIGRARSACTGTHVGIVARAVLVPTWAWRIERCLYPRGHGGSSSACTHVGIGRASSASTHVGMADRAVLVPTWASSREQC